MAAMERRQPKIDLSGLTDAQRDVRERLILIGIAAFGNRWRTDIANCIGERLGRPQSRSQVMGWVQGIRPVPDTIAALLPDLARDMAADLEKRAAVLRDLK
ncbi:MAG: hypothetical protein K2X54_19150 [Methylobacterium organophilum]|nr:hypothetical protein [Methylobacterium organophilum]